GDDLREDDGEAPGGEDRIERASVEPANEQELGQQTHDEPGRRGQRESQPRTPSMVGDDDGGIAADGEESAMSEVDDTHDTEHDEQTNRHGEEDAAGRHDVQGLLEHGFAFVEGEPPTGGATRRAAGATSLKGPSRPLLSAVPAGCPAGRYFGMPK